MLSQALNQIKLCMIFKSRIFLLLGQEILRLLLLRARIFILQLMAKIYLPKYLLCSLMRRKQGYLCLPDKLTDTEFI